MSPSVNRPAEETVRFHRLVLEGSLEELQAALQNGADVNAPGHVGITALMLALESKNLEKTTLLIQHGADPELTDDRNGTALRHAVEADFAEGVRYLLSLGVDRGYAPRYPLKQVDLPISKLLDLPLPVEMQGVMSETEWKASLVQTAESMQEMWQNPTIEPVIADVQSVEVLKLFLAAGDELNLAHTDVKRALVGLQTGGQLCVPPGEYRRHKSPRFGISNPERMDFPFWQDMIRTGGNAYSARTKYQDNQPFTQPGTVWCYERFGASLTALDDGRFVQIGGEHEDYYDPDFFIYNDVVIHDGHGDFQIYGYPADVFPPTDFHTATLCRDGIYIVGCLGHKNQRQPGFTPVYRLALETWQIEPVKTTGDLPGWIHNHHANYDPERNTLQIAKGQIHVDSEGAAQLVPNEHQFELNLAQLQWHRI